MPPKKQTPSEETTEDYTTIQTNHDTLTDSTPATTVNDADRMEKTTNPNQCKTQNKDILKIAPVYRVQAQIGADSKEMHVRILTVDTAAGPALICPSLIPKNCDNLIQL